MKLTTTQLRKIIREETAAMMPTGGKDPQRFLHGFESGRPMDDEGHMIKTRMADVKEMAEAICDLLDEGDQLPAWVQDLVASAHTDLEHVKDYLVGDEKMRNHKGVPQQAMPMESKKLNRKGMLLEGHARITPEEMRAWMGGDVGFVSEDANPMQPCPECGSTYAIDAEEEPNSLLCHDCGAVYPKRVVEASRKRGVPMPSDEEILEKYGHMMGYLDAKSGSHDPLWDELSRTYGSDFKTIDHVYARLRDLKARY